MSLLRWRNASSSKFIKDRVNGASFYASLNVNVKKFKKTRVNGGSNYDSLKVAKCLVS